MESKREDITSMMIWIFAKTNEFFFLSLTIPFDYTPIFGAGVNVLICYFEGSNA